jgi:hypothetical protein
MLNKRLGFSRHAGERRLQHSAKKRIFVMAITARAPGLY